MGRLFSVARILLFIAGGAAVLAGGLVGALWVWFRCGYYDEFEAVKKAFEDLPGVTVLRAGGNEDITFEDIWIEVNVEGQGRVMFFAVTEKSLSGNQPVLVAQLGDLVPRVAGYGHVGVYRTATREPVRSQFFSRAADIGPGGAFADQMAPPVRNVADAIERFSEIASFMSGWPRCPAFFEREEPLGTEVRYCVSNESEGAKWPPVPPEWRSDLTLRSSGQQGFALLPLNS